MREEFDRSSFSAMLGALFRQIMTRGAAELTTYSTIISALLRTMSFEYA